MICTMDPATEVRKLPPSVVRELSANLDYANAWKRLMAIIPKRFSCNDYRDHIAFNSLPKKYNSEHIRLIEQGSFQYRKSCTEILFEDWGTSGRPRPSLGYLKYLLTEAKLFRAADYVAELLGENPPPRPATGPAAIVPTSLPEITPHVNLKVAEAIHEIIVNDINSTAPNFCQNPLLLSRAKPQTSLPEVSDMMKFSKENVNNKQPGAVEENSVSAIASEVSLPLDDGWYSSLQDDFMPGFSKILADVSQKSNINSIVNSQISEGESKPELASENNLISVISALNQNTPKSDSDLIPDFDMLQSDIVLQSGNILKSPFI